WVFEPGRQLDDAREVAVDNGVILGGAELEGVLVNGNIKFRGDFENPLSDLLVRLGAAELRHSLNRILEFVVTEGRASQAPRGICNESGDGQLDDEFDQ